MYIADRQREREIAIDCSLTAATLTNRNYIIYIHTVLVQPQSREEDTVEDTQVRTVEDKAWRSGG